MLPCGHEHPEKSPLRARNCSQHLLVLGQVTPALGAQEEILQLGATSLLDWSLCYKVWDRVRPSSGAFTKYLLVFLKPCGSELSLTPSCIFGIRAQISETMV